MRAVPGDLVRVDSPGDPFDRREGTVFLVGVDETVKPEPWPFARVAIGGQLREYWPHELELLAVRT